MTSEIAVPIGQAEAMIPKRTASPPEMKRKVEERCASRDMFTDYGERGDLFAAAVQQHIGGPPDQPKE